MTCLDLQGITTWPKIVGTISGEPDVPSALTRFGWVTSVARTTLVACSKRSEARHSYIHRFYRSGCVTICCIMDFTKIKKNVLIVTDSRGAWLHLELRKYQLPHIKFSVMYRRGAKLRNLWEIIEGCLLTRPLDYIIILGGVCDITDRHVVDGVREYWPPTNLDARFDSIYRDMRDIARNFKLLTSDSSCKLVFLPEPGIDLVKYNRVLHPVPWRILVCQAELEERLELLQLYTRALNSYLGTKTLWTMDVTHAHRNGRLIPVYDHMTDGVHFSGHQVKKLADTLAYYTMNELIQIHRQAQGI